MRPASSICTWCRRSCRRGLQGELTLEFGDILLRGQNFGFVGDLQSPGGLRSGVRVFAAGPRARSGGPGLVEACSDRPGILEGGLQRREARGEDISDLGVVLGRCSESGLRLPDGRLDFLLIRHDGGLGGGLRRGQRHTGCIRKLLRELRELLACSLALRAACRRRRWLRR